MIAGENREPAVAILSDSTPAPADTTTASTTTTSTATTATTAGPAPVQAAALPFKRPAKPRPGDPQALSVNTKDGAVGYDVAYALVTVKTARP